MRPFFSTILVFIFAICSFAANESVTPFRVIIDPGHGGTDQGAGRDSFIEKKIVFAIAQKMKAELERREIQVWLTRESDINLSLSERVELANSRGADLFVSVHANWSRSTQVSGFEFYFAAQNANSANSLTKPNDIVAKIKKDLTRLGREKRSLEFSRQTQAQNPDKKSVIRRAPFYVIENTAMPAVLIEVGFISNRREAKRLTTPEYQTEIATLLAKSILSYKEKSDKKPALADK